MNLISKFLVFSIVFATGSLTLGYILSGLVIWPLVIIILGIIWLWEARQNRDWSASVFLAGFLGAAVWGVRLDVETGWMVLGLVASFSAWDLQHFSHRLKAAPTNEVTKHITHKHLHRLLLVNCLGLLLAGLALGIKLEIGFGTILFLTATAVVCLSWFIKMLRRESD